ncbi:hypothetical protein ACOI1H_15030 [Loktanella sp. DJP18]|uniref:hypothetical protein n=1 Tax=Loktanella sp. DJP18 TaxID=3409788 RepID=UPI003BB5186B
MVNGKHYIEPPTNDHDFRSLIQAAIAAGVGRDCSANGEPAEPWTAETLTAAINQAESGRSLIDLRTVQRWLAPQGRGGISVPNLHRLAKVFGCSDLRRTSAWQVALMRARERTKAEPRNGADDSSPADPTYDVAPPLAGDVPIRTPGLARSWEAWFSRDDTLKLSILIWAAYAVNGLVNGILGLLSVSYSVTPDLSKEVGFLWAPTWTILPALILPLFIMRVSFSLSHWRSYGRCRLLDGSSCDDRTEEDSSLWDARIDRTAFPFWMILVLCLGGVFLAQWVGICLRLYAEGEAGIYQIDRNLLTLIRPEFIGQGASALVSMFGYLYSALYVFIFLTALMFLFIMAGDYEWLARNINDGEIEQGVAIREGSRIALSAFDAALLIGWAAIVIKLQAAYLSSDAPDIALWIFHDLIGVLRLSADVNGTLPNTSVSHFTTFLMIAVANFALFVCALRVSRGQMALRQRAQDGNVSARPRFGYVPWKTFAIVQVFLVCTLLSIGQVQGFSLALVCSLVLSVWCLTRRRTRSGKKYYGTSPVFHGNR